MVLTLKQLNLVSLFLRLQEKVISACLLSKKGIEPEHPSKTQMFENKFRATVSYVFFFKIIVIFFNIYWEKNEKTHSKSH